jgi:hypothetical protein
MHRPAENTASWKPRRVRSAIEDVSCQTRAISRREPSATVPPRPLLVMNANITAGVSDVWHLCDCPLQPDEFGAPYTTLPPTMVIRDTMSAIFSSSTVSGSALRTARSANLPGCSEPLLSSSNVR